MKHICMAAMLVAAWLAAPGASAQVAPHNAAKFAEVFAKVEAIFGGRDGFQKAYEDARAEQARMEGALQLGLNLEARFRANNRPDLADIYLNAANSLKPSVDTLRATFAKFDALDSLLDEARGRAAYDLVAAEHAALFQRPVTEQFDYSKTHPLAEEPLKAVQTATQTLIAIAERKPS
ncbi:MAG: hypothetical protein ABMA14_26830 [Hyphomonadaceae bacterium]